MDISLFNQVIFLFFVPLSMGRIMYRDSDCPYPDYAPRYEPFVTNPRERNLTEGKDTLYTKTKDVDCIYTDRDRVILLRSLRIEKGKCGLGRKFFTRTEPPAVRLYKKPDCEYATIIFFATNYSDPETAFLNWLVINIDTEELTNHTYPYGEGSTVLVPYYISRIPDPKTLPNGTYYERRILFLYCQEARIPLENVTGFENVAASDDSPLRNDFPVKEFAQEHDLGRPYSLAIFSTRISDFDRNCSNVDYIPTTTTPKDEIVTTVSYSSTATSTSTPGPLQTTPCFYPRYGCPYSRYACPCYGYPYYQYGQRQLK